MVPRVWNWVVVPRWTFGCAGSLDHEILHKKKGDCPVGVAAFDERVGLARVDGDGWYHYYMASHLWFLQG